jgi:acetolactate synthase-1/2/3 large subunit
MTEDVIYGGEAIGRVLKEEGVEYIFGILGGHVMPLLGGIVKQGIRLIHMRHEQAGVYAADGYARAAGKTGVCFGTAGPGMTNMLSGVAQAHNCRVPVLCLFGQHPTTEDLQEPIQEAYGAEICKSITKWSHRVTEWKILSLSTQKAIRDTMAYPTGPVALEIPLNTLYHSGPASTQISYQPGARFPSPLQTASTGNSETIERVVEMLLAAERPVIVAGEGLHWADAASELNELIQILQIPVMTRRISRGAVPENDPLSFSGRARREILNNSDMAVAIGLRLGYLEGYGSWARRVPRFVQINEAASEIKETIPTDEVIVGHPKLVLRQMIEVVKQEKNIPVKQDWLNTVQELMKKSREVHRKEAEEAKNGIPVHPAYLAQEIVDFLDDSATIVYDAFTGTYYLTPRIQASFSGQILDAGEYAGVGQGVGMALGAQLARPGRQVLAMMGDGGMGIGGFDVETAIRYKLPAVFLVNNNSTWMAGSFGIYESQFGKENNWDITPGMRYDRIFEGAENYHAENVERPEEIRPALERAFNSGKTSVINVVVDPKVYHGMMKIRNYYGHREDTGQNRKKEDNGPI